ncbi:hypothetical protein BJP27_24275 (plasmid) [Pseudomonas oryzihabitans]|nr:hypothetical protein BJP27_24275 [Pseudomonas psychrotolerans]
MIMQSIDRFIDLKSWDARRQAEEVIATLAVEFSGEIQVGRPFEPVPYPKRRHPKGNVTRKTAGMHNRLAAEHLFRVVPQEEVQRILGFGPNTCLRHNWGNWVPQMHAAYLRELMANWPTLEKARDLLRKAYSLNHVAATLQVNKTELSDKLRAFKMDVPHVV